MTDHQIATLLPIRFGFDADTARRHAGHLLSGAAVVARVVGTVFMVIALVLLLTVMSPAQAGEAGPTWVVSKVSGKAEVRDGAASWQGLDKGTVLGGGVEIRTGEGGHVVLTHRKTTITVTPESQLALPQGADSTGVYRVTQTLGTLLYRIKARAASMMAFEVETPYLAAVVKGTVFTVTASTQGASVHVTEGVVGVEPILGGAGATLTIGQTARISSTPGASMTVQGGAKPGKDAVPNKVRNEDQGKKPAANPRKTQETGRVKAVEAKADGIRKEGSDRGTDNGDDRHSERVKDQRIANPAVIKAAPMTRVVIRKSDAGIQNLRAEHPRAIPIFGRGTGNHDLFAGGKTIATAFKDDDRRKARRTTEGRDGNRVKGTVRRVAGSSDMDGAKQDRKNNRHGERNGGGGPRIRAKASVMSATISGNGEMSMAEGDSGPGPNGAGLNSEGPGGEGQGGEGQQGALSGSDNGPSDGGFGNNMAADGGKSGAGMGGGGNDGGALGGGDGGGNGGNLANLGGDGGGLGGGDFGGGLGGGNSGGNMANNLGGGGGPGGGPGGGGLGGGPGGGGPGGGPGGGGPGGGPGGGGGGMANNHGGGGGD